MSARTRRIPAKIKNVTEVPTAGILINVGTKVPMMLPTVLAAFSVPTTFPLSSRLSTVYFTSDGVTVPKRKRGNTKMSMHATKAAMTRKLVLIEKIRTADMPTMIYLPRTGMSAIHTAAIRILLYSLSGLGSLSAIRPP